MPKAKTILRDGPPSFHDAFELRVALRDIEPAIWRRVRVPAAATLGLLHDVLQIAFGWKDYHLHDFLVGDIRFAVIDAEDEIFAVDEHAAPLGAVGRTGSKLVYNYDYGDGWEHEIEVERVLPQGDELLVCTGGARACPPEDCGGAPGYAHLIEVLANPGHEEHREMKQWVGRGYDPEKLDVAAVNKKLATLSRKLARRRR